MVFLNHRELVKNNSSMKFEIHCLDDLLQAIDGSSEFANFALILVHYKDNTLIYIYLLIQFSIEKYSLNVYLVKF